MKLIPGKKPSIFLFLDKEIDILNQPDIRAEIIIFINDTFTMKSLILAQDER